MDIDLTINSILNQSVEQKLYKILLIISVNGINSKLIFPKQIKSLKKLKKIRIIIIKKELNLQTKLIIAIKEYPQNPILIIKYLFKYIKILFIYYILLKLKIINNYNI